ncbi:MAG: class I SAM-dependent methyltransferase [Bacteroidota bacterium]
MNCIICESSSSKLLYNNTLKRCNQCGFITANTEISDVVLSEIYSENYFKGGEYLNYLSDKDGIVKNFKNRLLEIKKIYPNFNPSNAIEIGCAYGLFGELLKKEYPTTDYIGYDVVPEACKHANEELKLNVKCENYLNNTINNNYSDIFLWDVIEHLPNPALFIKKLSEQSKSGSRIYISTGDISSLLAKIQGSKWRQIHPPSHLHYFSKQTLSRLLENEGFITKKVFYPSVSRSLKQIFYSLFLLNKQSTSKIINGIYNRIPENSYFNINTYDLLFLIAEKK